MEGCIERCFRSSSSSSKIALGGGPFSSYILGSAPLLPYAAGTVPYGEGGAYPYTSLGSSPTIKKQSK